jgi:hypothetical protein
VKSFPPTPAAEDAPELFESGHLWLLEQVTGAPLRIQLQESGLLRFGDRDRAYDDADALPLSVQHAVRHVREQLDRDALRAAVDDPESVVLFGVAPRYEGIDYDWERLPAFLGVDVRAGSEGAFRPPDAAETIFERLGLQPVNAFERERRARDFDPEPSEIPASNWNDGPAAGVLVRNKRGGRAVLRNPDVDAEPPPLELPADELAAAYATSARFESVAKTLRERNWTVTVETLCERVVEEIVREKYARLDAGSGQLDESAFTSAVARRARQYLGTG